ncbi:efflux RND transporter periplasmic adaptor subunit [Shewanella avicenniae]|uniref:Efflux RND transporter periplasmic adaptor subunit n=1 Tax=Shewanella avicenniae TaxID=2814294 RepID=A0ABX7QVJ3_9GAMM|nr:efflux RND transporter periplasmic adaptor subunit [Shewanella avicenniae]QSX35522.1 efflux RND transporter periplasmic adaptor subunit [Shewanella avicenniae]
MKKLVIALAIAAFGTAVAYRMQAADKAETGKAAHSQTIPVVTATVGQQALAADLRLIGKLSAEHSVFIASQVTGKIEKVAVRSNEQVSAGQTLIVIDDAKAKAAVMEAEAYLADESRKLKDYEKLAHSNAITQTEIDAQRASVNIATARLASAKAELEYHYIKAPFAGVIGLVSFSRGKMVSQGEELLSLDDLSLLRLDLQVPEAHLSQLTLGMKVAANSAAWPAENFDGKVTAIDPRINEQTLNVRTRVQFQNLANKLRPGMMLNTRISFPATYLPVVPVQALEYSGTKRFVYKVDDKQIAHRTEVQLGTRVDNQVLITDGLKPGDEIVVQGLVNIRDGMQVKPLKPTAAVPEARQAAAKENNDAAV